MDMQCKAVLFDLGATLRILKKSEINQNEARLKLVQLAGTDMTPEAFEAFLDERYEGYRKWCFETMREATEEDLFCKWLLPDYPQELIRKNAVALALQYRLVKGFRVTVEGGVEVIRELHRRGYRLGIISNLITSQEVPDWLEQEHLTPYFDVVLLSAVCGLRKPDPAIYRLGAEKIGVDPSECAYVGDNFNRDVTGAKAANYGMNVIYTSAKKLEKQMATVSDANRPDGIVFDFSELLAVFPGAPKADFTKLREI